MFKSILINLTVLAVTLTAFQATVISRPKGPGDKVDDFTMKNYDGTSYTLSNIKDSKAVVLMFWSTQCPWVKAYNQRVVDLANEYIKQNVTFWAINANSTETSEDIQAQATEYNYPFPELKDVNNVLADELGATRTPEIFVLDNNDVIVYHGRVDDNGDVSKVSTRDLKNALDEILSGKDVTVKNTKSFGCSIKRAS